MVNADDVQALLEQLRADVARAEHLFSELSPAPLRERAIRLTEHVGRLRDALIAWEKWAQVAEGPLAAAAVHGIDAPEWPRAQGIAALEALGPGRAD